MIDGGCLLVDGRTVARVEVAATRSARRRGLLGRAGIDGALLLRPAGSVHTFGMRFPLDVALCTRGLRVVAVRTLPPGQLTRPRLGVRAVIEAEAGSFARWGLAPGAQLSIAGPIARGPTAVGPRPGLVDPRRPGPPTAP